MMNQNNRPARNDAAEIMAEFRAVWNEFKAGLKGRDVDNPELAWSIFCASASQLVFSDAEAARRKLNERR